jgi:hypothetical protein
MAGGVMVAENPERIHIFLPHDIIEVDAVGDNLIVVACPGTEGHEEEEKHSFKLNPGCTSKRGRKSSKGWFADCTICRI